MPVVPVRRAEHNLMVLLLIVSLIDVVAVEESVVTVLVVDTHCFYLFFLRFVSLSGFLDGDGVALLDWSVIDDDLIHLLHFSIVTAEVGTQTR